MNTHAIIAFTGSHILIGKKENELLHKVGLSDWFETSDGQRIKGSAIAEILTISEYYSRFPDKRPVTNSYDQPDFHSPKTEYIPIEKQAESSKKNFRGLLQGLKQYCESHPEAKNARKMYDEKLSAYKLKYGK